jgi:acetylornithine deacetylase/succinyl-diaminopimelate desuccinylase-like protein
MSNLDARVAELAAKYLPLAAEILKEAIRIPADYVDKPVEQGGDPLCGLSNHEKPRLEYLKKRIVEIGAVRRPEDAYFDDFGNLVWWVEDPKDGIPAAQKKVVYIDGHTDTVRALRAQWREKVGGVDCYDGLVDASKVNKDFLKKQLGYVPPESEWNQLIFGRGSADQLGGVVAAIVATKILLELAGEGALKGVIVRSYGTVCEEDNDGAGPMYLNRKVFPTAPPEVIPDVVIVTDGTGCSKNGALGIYRGQRGRMQIEVTVTGRSCHGSMPWEGLNPFEYGSAIVKEAAEKYEKREGFLDDKFLGHGTRTASWARLDTPSDCAVPDKLVFRFDRRLTIGETPEQAVADVEKLAAVATARKAGLKVEVTVPLYTDPS